MAKWIIEAIEQKVQRKESSEEMQKFGKSQSLDVSEIREGKMIDVMDFMSKWANAIVIKVDSKKFEVVVEGGLQMEIQKDDSSGVIAIFQSKTGKCGPEKVQKLKNYVKEDMEEEKELTNVIMKKGSKGKRHHNNVSTPTIEESEKIEVRIQLLICLYSQ